MKSPGDTQRRHRRITPQVPRTITLQFTDKVTQTPVIDHQHVAGPGVRLRDGAQHGIGGIAAKAQLLAGIDAHRWAGQIGAAHFNRMFLHADPRLLRVVAHDKTGAQRADAAFSGMDHKGPRQ
ncbi:hypothetical protein D3C85_1490230 [compost metagenome]